MRNASTTGDLKISDELAWATASSRASTQVVSYGEKEAVASLKSCLIWLPGLTKANGSILQFQAVQSLWMLVTILKGWKTVCIYSTRWHKECLLTSGRRTSRSSESLMLICLDLVRWISLVTRTKTVTHAQEFGILYDSAGQMTGRCSSMRQS